MNVSITKSLQSNPREFRISLKLNPIPRNVSADSLLNYVLYSSNAANKYYMLNIIIFKYQLIS